MSPLYVLRSLFAFARPCRLIQRPFTTLVIPTASFFPSKHFPRIPVVSLPVRGTVSFSFVSKKLGTIIIGTYVVQFYCFLCSIVDFYGPALWFSTCSEVSVRIPRFWTLVCVYKNVPEKSIQCVCVVSLEITKTKNTVHFSTLPSEYRSEFYSIFVLISGAMPGNVAVGSDRLKIEKSTAKVLCEHIVICKRRTRP